MDTYDAAVIGAGPAGAMAAYEMASQGLKVIIIEKKKLPRYKVCGGGLVYRGLRNLPFDISDAIDLQYKQIDIFFKNGAYVQSTSDRPTVSMVMRDSFDHMLVEKAQEKGAILKSGEKLTGLHQQEGQILLKTSKQEYRVQAVIAADGAYSPTAKLAGWKNETRQLVPALEYEIYVSPEVYARYKDKVRFDMDAVPRGYGWCFPKNGHLSVGVGGFFKPDSKSNLKSSCMDYIKTLGITEIKEIKKYGFNIPIGPRTDGFVKNNVFIVGDAAGFADPITAEGISNALLTGRMAGQAIATSPENISQAAIIYQNDLQANLLPQLATAAKLAKWFYGNERLRSFLIKRYGNYFAKYLTQIFSGDRNYPVDLKKSLMRKGKRSLWKFNSHKTKAA